ncbi:hypothetical protein HK100_011434 [Physocladia obscura]|uniref:Uncharacterized protein n=1 Tax=Physocladia obscura TaxID=109957 RepID=A0AAD5XE63_9FUNG|nr:hypothetical protein HK100_011434 [Physocladia obscura]
MTSEFLLTYIPFANTNNKSRELQRTNIEPQNPGENGDNGKNESATTSIDNTDTSPDITVALSIKEHGLFIQLLTNDIESLLRVKDDEAFVAAANEKLFVQWLANYVDAQLALMLPRNETTAQSVEQQQQQQHNSTGISVDSSDKIGSGIDDDESGSHAIPQPLVRKEARLRHRVFNAIVRLSIAEPDSIALPLLLGICRVYGPSNLPQVGVIFDRVDRNGRDTKNGVNNQNYTGGSNGRLYREIADARAFFVGMVRTIQKRIEKSANVSSKFGGGSNSGKGKGKGKAVESTSSSSSLTTAITGTDNDDDNLETKKKDSKNLQDLRLLIDALQSFDALILASSVTKKSLSDSFANSIEFIHALIGCYEIANILCSSKSRVLDPNETPTASLTFLNNPLDSHTQTEAALIAVDDPLFVAECRNLKIATLAVLDTVLTVSFFNPLGIEITAGTSMERITQPPRLTGDGNILEEELDAAAATARAAARAADVVKTADRLCDLLLVLLEASPIDEPAVFLVASAPLLVDLEVETGVSERLKGVKNAVVEAAVAAGGGLEDGNDARVEFLVVSLQQMLAFSGNAGARLKRVEERIIRAAAVSERLAAAFGNKKVNRKERKIRTAGFAVDEMVPVTDEDYINRTILISQVHDLFPDLGEGFIELLTMKILEDDLPDVVKKLDRNLARSALPSTTTTTAIRRTATAKSKKSSNHAADDGSEAWPTLAQDSVLASRKNVFDNDEFDVFANKKIDAKKVIWGKKDKSEDVLSSSDAASKQAIMSLHSKTVAEDLEIERLLRADTEASQIYDDEYDDTYDSIDIKLAGTVELHMLDESENSVDAGRVRRVHASTSNGGSVSDAIEAELFAIAARPEKDVLEVKARRSVARQRLKAKLGWGDEQIEGWYKMYLRDPRQQKKLEEKFAWRGNKGGDVSFDQRESDQEEDGDVEQEQEKPQNGNGGGQTTANNNSRIMEPSHIRGGRGGGRGGRGGGRGGKVNHKNQHAKKMAQNMNGLQKGSEMTVVQVPFDPDTITKALSIIASNSAHAVAPPALLSQLLFYGVTQTKSASARVLLQCNNDFGIDSEAAGFILLDGMDTPLLGCLVWFRDGAGCSLCTLPESPEHDATTGCRQHSFVADSFKQMYSFARDNIDGFKNNERIMFRFIAGQYIPVLQKRFVSEIREGMHKLLKHVQHDDIGAVEVKQPNAKWHIGDDEFIMDLPNLTDVDTIIRNNKYEYPAQYVSAILDDPVLQPMARIIRHVATGNAVSWCLVHKNLSLGVLWTMPAFRGRGIAKVCVAAVTDAVWTFLAGDRVAGSRVPAITSVGKTVGPHAYTLPNNTMSLKMFAGLGYRVVDGEEVDWAIVQEGKS